MIIIFALIVISFISSLFVSDLTIRKHILLSGYPLQSILADVGNNYEHDPMYGNCYNVSGWTDRQTKMDITGVCLKKNSLGINYVTSQGAG